MLGLRDHHTFVRVFVCVEVGVGGKERAYLCIRPLTLCMNLVPKRDTRSAVSSGFMVTTMWQKRELVRQGHQ